MNKIGFLTKFIDQPTFMVKIINNYLQIVSIIGTFDLEELNFFINFSGFIGNPIILTSNLFDCFLKKFS